VLNAYKKAWGGHRMKGFQLQRKVEGVEVAICGFFNGNEFIDQVNFNFEHKKLFPGNIGPSTGEMGTSMFWAGQNKLFKETFGKLEGWRANEGYVGSIDLNCIVNETGIYPLEFTPRFGYPTIALQEEESIESSTGAFFADLARGNEPEVDVHNGYQIAVRIVLPPFPFDDEKTYDENSRNAAVVFETESRDGIHLEDAKRVDGQWRVAGNNGMPIVVTGKGDTMQARARAGVRPDRRHRDAQHVLPRRYRRALDRRRRRPVTGVGVSRAVNTAKAPPGTDQIAPSDRTKGTPTASVTPPNGSTASTSTADAHAMNPITPREPTRAP